MWHRLVANLYTTLNTVHRSGIRGYKIGTIHHIGCTLGNEGYFAAIVCRFF